MITGEPARPSLVAPGVRSGAQIGEAMVRQYERSRGRHLLDTRLGGWEDLDSEAMLIIRATWGSTAARWLQRASNAPFVSFRDGAPHHVVDIQVHATPLHSVSVSHDQLVTAASLGERYRLYLVFEYRGNSPHLVVLSDPAASTWTPSTTGGRGGGAAASPRWHCSVDDLRHCGQSSASAA